MIEKFKDYEEIKKAYPKTMSKDQFYKVAHISKATALFLLQTGLVPCKDSKKKTRRYTIKTKDVISYTLLEMINASEAREDDETFKNPVDKMFDELEAEEPEHFAVKQYRKYKLAAGKTAKSILISCGARLAPFDIAELRELMSYDELELDTLGERKSALFVIISDTDDTFNFVAAIMYSQLFNLLCDKADNEYGGRLPIHVRCLLDEFANIGQIPKFDKLIATIRSREISASIILQSQSQLKALYKDKSILLSISAPHLQIPICRAVTLPASSGQKQTAPR